LINQGLWALSAVTCGIHALSVGLLLLLPKMRSRIDEMGGGSGTLGPSRHDTNGGNSEPVEIGTSRFNRICLTKGELSH
jgi:hypothetical protein